MLDRVLPVLVEMGLFWHLNCVLMLNWIVWNRTVLIFICVEIQTILILNGSVWNRTVWLNWIAWNRKVLTIKLSHHPHHVALQRLICHKNQTNKQTNKLIRMYKRYLELTIWSTDLFYSIVYAKWLMEDHQNNVTILCWPSSLTIAPQEVTIWLDLVTISENVADFLGGGFFGGGVLFLFYLFFVCFFLFFSIFLFFFFFFFE